MLLVAVGLLPGCAPNKVSRPPESTTESTYAPSDSCRACHAEIAESYGHVAMARSLYRPPVATTA
jgi:hypothetical protein